MNVFLFFFIYYVIYKSKDNFDYRIKPIIFKLIFIDVFNNLDTSNDNSITYSKLKIIVLINLIKNSSLH